ncbi:hypothetical protein V8G54_000191 (mitochondrion) [Vigna mungo]|uniref:DUF8018 domain-containing protein n=1 Tax=Vigna mungo TaxID=3915 RepID=A0AAQ3PK43_VIGMU
MGEPSSVNQEVTRPVPPANPVASGEAEAGPSHGVTPFQYEEDEVIGGETVRAIQTRLLGKYDFPTAHEIDMAQVNAQDLFEVKVEIIRLMQGLHPVGDWLRRGARALDNPRTLTGEESFEKLSLMLDDLKADSFQSATFRLLVDRVHLRAADEDEHSAA